MGRVLEWAQLEKTMGYWRLRKVLDEVCYDLELLIILSLNGLCGTNTSELITVYCKALTIGVLYLNRSHGYR